jgi:hypothetical protein
VHEATPGSYWLDEAAWAARQKRIRKAALVILAVLLGVVACAAVVAMILVVQARP